MRESKLIQKLREVKVFNSYNFYTVSSSPDGAIHVPKDCCPYIDNFVGSTGRGVFPPNWAVYQAGVNLNPNGHWSNHGSMSFTYSGREDKKRAFAEAVAWAQKKYGIKEWIRDPFGSFGPKEFVEKRLADLLRKFDKLNS